MLKRKVMDDLDALLADLQSTTSHISDYQQGSQSATTTTTPGDLQATTEHISDYRQGSQSATTTTTPSDLQATTSHISDFQQGSQGPSTTTPGSGTDASSRESTPPPLPPPPPKDVVDSIHQESMYEVQQVKPVSSAPQPVVSRPGLPPPTAPKPQHITSTQHSTPPPTTLTTPPPCLTPKPMSSSLSSNLSELDMLLQDLSSAQFMAEVDRRNAANMSHDSGNAIVSAAPVISTKPGQERTVDSLLFELENTVPPPPSSPRTVPVTQSMVGPGAVSQSTHYEVIHQAYRHPGPQSVPAVSSTQTANPAYSRAAPTTAAVMSPVQTAMTTSGNASTATRELEDLMASLSEFKVSGAPQVTHPPHIGDPPYAYPQKSPKPSGMHPNSGASGGLAGGPASPGPSALGAPAAGSPQPDGAVGSQAASQDRMVHTHEVCQGIMSGPGATSQVAGTSGGTSDNNNLDAMLGNLHTDMTRQGIMTVPKGHCAACAKPIVGQVITALGKIWHPEHFNCVHCKEELGTRNFFERDGQPYCEQDYHNLFSPRCAHCSGPILDKCVTALDKSWHPEHFFCAQCGRLFADDGFHEKDGKAYCREDYFEMFAPKCGGCGRPIMDNYISALNRQWHPECFICQECHIPFGGGSFFDHEGMPYCETHYHAKRGSLCAGCHKPITGRCITAMYKKFHPEHFVCAFCLKQLNKGTFKEQNEKPYCHPCFIKLFG